MDNRQPEYLHSLNEALFYKLNLANSNHIGDLYTLYTAHFTKKRLACSEKSVFSLDIVEHAQGNKNCGDLLTERAKRWEWEKKKIDGLWTSLGATESCISQKKQITIG